MLSRDFSGMGSVIGAHGREEDDDEHIVTALSGPRSPRPDLSSTTQPLLSKGVLLWI